MEAIRLLQVVYKNTRQKTSFSEMDNYSTGGKSISPLISELLLQRLLHARWEVSPEGKREKYFYITTKGKKLMEQVA